MIENINKILSSVGKHLLELKSNKRFQGAWEGNQFKAEADKLANRMMTDLLREITPGIEIISEEDKKSQKQIRPKLYWLIDPIDGTRSFVEGFDGYVTQLALIEKNNPKISGIYAPERREMYLSEEKKGVYLNGKVLVKNNNFNKIILIDNYEKPKGIANYLYNKLDCDKYIECGSIGLKLCKIIDGTANLFVKDVTVYVWDIAPAHLMLNELGYKITNYNGLDITYNTNYNINGLISSNREDLIKLTNKIVKEKIINVKKN